MKINIAQGDLFSIPCDAYVNPTDIHLSGSGGLDKIIHSRGGCTLEQECISLRNNMKVGHTVVTGGGDLHVKYILHTACPKYTEGKTDNYYQLAECYHNMLSKAAGKSDIHHLTLPLIGTGSCGYSLNSPYYGDTLYSLTAVTLLSTIMRFKRPSLHTVTIVCSSKDNYDILQNTFRWITGKGVDTRSRIRGSLLGGAVGDALGYPVEFKDAVSSRVREYTLDNETGTALISDDTQMTLFTACGLLYGYSRGCMKGIGGDMWNYIAPAYDDWLKTQCPDYQKQKPTVSWIRNIPELNSRRAPGTTCLSALQAGGGSIHNPINNSKGCGGVMRIAPIALYGAANRHWDKQYNMTICAEAAAITHGHPLGWLSAAALGNILFDIMQNFSLQYAVQDTLLLLKTEYSDYSDLPTLINLIKKAKELADITGHTSSVDLMTEYNITEELGEGWVGEEALAIGLFCALATGNRGFDQCMWNAVGHRGDSDSTASIAGQILGAYLGEDAISKNWLQRLELRDIITEIADDLTNDCRISEYNSYHDPAWIRKYLSEKQSSHIPQPGEYSSPKYILIPWSEKAINSRAVDSFDIHGQVIGKYEVLLENGTFYHVSKNKEIVQTGSLGFGFVTLKYNEEKQAYTEHHGWVKMHSRGTLHGYYNNRPFTLILNHVDKCAEIFSNASPSPWIGTIRRKFDEWDNPIEFRFKDSISAMPTYPFEILIFSNEYLRNFFQ